MLTLLLGTEERRQRRSSSRTAHILCLLVHATFSLRRLEAVAEVAADLALLTEAAAEEEVATPRLQFPQLSWTALWSSTWEPVGRKDWAPHQQDLETMGLRVETPT